MFLKRQVASAYHHFSGMNKITFKAEIQELITKYEMKELTT